MLYLSYITRISYRHASAANNSTLMAALTTAVGAAAAAFWVVVMLVIQKQHKHEKQLRGPGHCFLGSTAVLVSARADACVFVYAY